MAKAIPIPKFHDIPIGAELEDVTGLRYRVVGSRRAPLSSLPGAWTRKVLSLRRLSDGVTQEVGESAMHAVVAYHPPARTRTRARSPETA